MVGKSATPKTIETSFYGSLAPVGDWLLVPIVAGIWDDFDRSLDFQAARSYLKENLTESISIDDLAKRAGMSRAVFHRKFKLATSYSPIQFIKAVRLNQAAMLIAGGSSVTDAAYQVGYVSQSQFSREFRRQFGRAPSRWGGVAGADVQAVS